MKQAMINNNFLNYNNTNTSSNQRLSTGSAHKDEPVSQVYGLYSSKSHKPSTFGAARRNSNKIVNHTAQQINNNNRTIIMQDEAKNHRTLNVNRSIEVADIDERGGMTTNKSSIFTVKRQSEPMAAFTVQHDQKIPNREK